MRLALICEQFQKQNRLQIDYYYFFYCPRYLESRELKTKTKNSCMERLLVRITHKTLSQKNGVKTLQSDSKALKRDYYYYIIIIIL